VYYCTVWINKNYDCPNAMCEYFATGSKMYRTAEGTVPFPCGCFEAALALVQSERSIFTAAEVTSLVPMNHLPDDFWDETSLIAMALRLSPLVPKSAAAIAGGALVGARSSACSTSLRTLGSRKSSLMSGWTLIVAPIMNIAGNFISSCFRVAGILSVVPLAQHAENMVKL
jgi:hypothetical protein